jgi:nucleoside phosphorylase
MIGSVDYRALLTAPAPQTARDKLKPIPWPPTLQPSPVRPSASGADPLPAADVLIVTWTTAEAQALADVLSPGVSLTDWLRYTNGYDALIVDVEKGAPAHEEKDLARYWQATIGGRSVILMKSDLHMSQDGPKLPVRTLWKQIIEQASPQLVITTGTAGGIGAQTVLGDVVVTDIVRFDCQRDFAAAPFAQASYTATRSVTLTTDVSTLLDVNAVDLPTSVGGNGHATVIPGVVLTTDFFAFDDTEDTYGLRAYEPAAAAVEMGDAVLGLVCAEDLTDPPAWVIARNASDPQMPQLATVQDEANRAANIYQTYGYTTTIGSAIVCAALVADL